jgi:hypothetical protein
MTWIKRAQISGIVDRPLRTRCESDLQNQGSEAGRPNEDQDFGEAAVAAPLAEPIILTAKYVRRLASTRKSGVPLKPLRFRSLWQSSVALWSIEDVSTDRPSVAVCPRRQGITSPVSNDDRIQEVRRAGRRIPNKSSEHRINNLSCGNVARIVRRELLYLIFASHPRFKLPGVCDHVLDPVTPTAVPLAVKDDVNDRGFANLSFA